MENRWQKITTFGFLSIIGGCFLFYIMGSEFLSENLENRQKEKLPPPALKQGLKKYTEDFAHYYNDHFPFRTPSVKFYTGLKNDVFHTQPFPRRVIAGNNDFFFLGDSYSNALSESKGFINFSEKELSQVKENILHYQDWLKEKGISFYLTIAPNKLSVYGDQLNITPNNKPTKLQQIQSLLKEHSIPFLNLGEGFKDQSFPTYRIKNSHWNAHGSFLAYQNLTNLLTQDYPKLPIIKRSDLNFYSEEKYAGSLIDLVTDNPMEVTVLSSFKKSEKASLQKDQNPVPVYFGLNPDNYETRYTGEANNLKILVFRDSFFNSLGLLLKESFGESVFIWDYTFNKELIEKEKPDIVLFEVVERAIDTFAKAPPSK